MSKLPSWRILFGAAGIGGMAVGVMGLILLKEIDKVGNRSSYVLRAINYTKRQPVIKELVGEEIHVHRGTFQDEFGHQDETSARFRIPIEGEKDKAFIYAYARRQNANEFMKLYKLEAEFKNISGKKLILLDRSGEDPASDDEWDREQFELDMKYLKGKSGRELADEERRRIQSMSVEERRKYYAEQMKEMASGVR